MIELIASAESASEHALGKAIVNFAKRVLAKETFSKCSAYQAVPGYGLKASVVLDERVFNKNNEGDRWSFLFST